MRVTANTFSDSLVDQLASLAVRQNRLQTQAASGQKIELPEDDPSAMRRVLDLQSEAKTLAQYRRNITTLREQAQASYEVMRGLKRISDRASELAVQADSLKPQDQLNLFAIELNQLIKQAVQLANTKFRGDYLLAGTRSDATPFAMTTDANGNVTGVTYQGNQSVPESEIAEGVTVSAQVVGENAGGAGPRGLITDTRFGADFFNHLIALRNHLQAGDVAAVASTDRPALARDEENFVLHFGNNGALQARLETAEAIASRRVESLEVLVSKEADADLAQTLVRLTQTQNAYRAALQSGASLLQTNLLDFLR